MKYLAIALLAAILLMLWRLLHAAKRPMPRHLQLSVYTTMSPDELCTALGMADPPGINFT